MSGRRQKGPSLVISAEWRRALADKIAAKGLSQGEAAAEAGVSQTTVSRVLSGELKATRRAAALAKAFGLPLPSAQVAGAAHGDLIDIGREILSLDAGAFADFVSDARKTLDRIRARTKNSANRDR